MDLLFKDSESRHQCSYEFLQDDCQMQCSFSTSTYITFPKGWFYFNGQLEEKEITSNSNFYICQNHQMRLKVAFKEGGLAKI